MSIELMSLKPSFSNTYLSMNKCTNKILILLLYTLYLLTYFLNSDLFHAVILLIWKKVFSLCDISESYIFIKACFVPIPVLILVQWDIIIMPLGKISPQNEIVMNALSPYLLYIIFHKHRLEITTKFWHNYVIVLRNIPIEIIRMGFQIIVIGNSNWNIL